MNEFEMINTMNGEDVQIDYLKRTNSKSFAYVFEQKRISEYLTSLLQI